MQQPHLFRKSFVVLLVICVAFASLLFVTAPGKNFPTNYTFVVEKGDSLKSISLRLLDEHIIRSRTLFEFFVILDGGDKTINEGDYLFEKPLPIYEIAARFSKNQFGLSREKITIPEGYTNVQIADTFANKLSYFNKENFLTQVAGREGYLFPDTYLIFGSRDENYVLEKINKNYEKKIAPLREQIKQSGHSEKEIIIMASLVEKEANGDKDRAIIAGILWNRINKNIPLQVDAPFAYLLGKDSSELTLKDLKMDSPFNTYTHKGLPPAPIGNPGLLAIKAVLNPEPSDYLFYLHAPDGTVYYAKTFAEHVKNKRYLK